MKNSNFIPVFRSSPPELFFGKGFLKATLLKSNFGMGVPKNTSGGLPLVKLFFQPGPLPEVLTIANLQTRLEQDLKESFDESIETNRRTGYPICLKSTIKTLQKQSPRDVLKKGCS